MNRHKTERKAEEEEEEEEGTRAQCMLEHYVHALMHAYALARMCVVCA